MQNKSTSPVQTDRSAARDSAAAGDKRLLRWAAGWLSAIPAGYLLGSFLGSRSYGGMLTGLIVASVGLFLLAFTGRPTRARMVWMVRYCYLFCFIAVLAAILPFFLLDASFGVEPVRAGHGTTSVAKRGGADASIWLHELKRFVNAHLRGNNAMGVEVGCRKRGDRAAAWPNHVDCDTAGFQWVVHIGGTLVPAQRQAINDTSGDGNHRTPGASPPDFHYAELRQLQRDSRATKSSISGTGRANVASTPRHRSFFVEGGLIFPLYLVVISLIGGAVSLTRRVPAIQCRFWEEGNLSLEQMIEKRQDLILQMMQFVSAPFVAMIAFAMLEPPSMGMAVGVAFLSGFSSEYVLVTIARVFETLKPESKAKA